MTLALSTFLTALVSALVPVVNIEIILGVAATRLDLGPGSWQAVGLAVAAGAGQTAGKVVWYYAALLSWDSHWVQKKVTNPKWRRAYDRWRARIDGRPWLAGGVVFVASFTGFPPLLVLAMLAGTLKMPLWVYVPTVLVGRCLRFWLVLVGVGRSSTRVRAMTVLEVNPYVIGLITLGILMLMLVGLLAFGAGREHS